MEEKETRNENMNVKVDERPALIQSNTQNEIEIIKNEKNYATKVMHRDQFIESTHYLCKKDVYELFKVVVLSVCVCVCKSFNKNILATINITNQSLLIEFLRCSQLI